MLGLFYFSRTGISWTSFTFPLLWKCPCLSCPVFFFFFFPSTVRSLYFLLHCITPATLKIWMCLQTLMCWSHGPQGTRLKNGALRNDWTWSLWPHGGLIHWWLSGPLECQSSGRKRVTGGVARKALFPPAAFPCSFLSARNSAAFLCHTLSPWCPCFRAGQPWAEPSDEPK